jgi:NTE family protein
MPPALAPWLRRVAAAFLAASLLGGCVGKAVLNNPLPADRLSDKPGPISRDGYRPIRLDDPVAPEALVLLAFSGGGKRSAAFGYGVLKGLRDYSVTVDGEQHSLLSLLDMTASVSGGSFPAAYYGLYRDKIFTDFDKDFLSQDLDAYIYGTYLLPWRLGWMFSSDYGTNDRMAEVYDDLMFHGATFADLQNKGRPFVAIDATDVDYETAFPFMQDQFDLICSDLTSYPVARAVAASNGFPVIFTPITLKSYRSDCRGREPAWVKADTSSDPLNRVHQEAEIARKYLDADATKWVHLMDGGIADNLAMREMLNMMMIITGEQATEARFDLSHLRRVILISADGQAANTGETAKEKDLSSLGQIFNAVSGTQIDSYNFETMILAKAVLDRVRDAAKAQRCAKGPVVDGHPCGDVESYFAHLSLAGVADPKERAYLQQIATGLTIPKPDVDRLVVAGQTQVMTSRDIQAFRDGLK